jgi:hypothetical protein
MKVTLRTGAPEFNSLLTLSSPVDFPTVLRYFMHRPGRSISGRPAEVAEKKIAPTPS